MQLTKRVSALILLTSIAYSCFAATPTTTSATATPDADTSSPKYLSWLEQQSLLANATTLAKEISGNSTQWLNAYAVPQAQKIVHKASVWFSAYPNAMIAKPEQSTLQFLGDKALWDTFSQIGINALHTGPTKVSGGIQGRQYTPTVDGWFDRINLKIDPKFGTNDEYKAMTKMAGDHNAIIAGDIIPGHTGRGADFLLAEANYKDYLGIYTMVQIKQADWGLLPEVTNRWETVNLTPQQEDTLIAKGYLPGRLQRVLFTVPGESRVFTGWDATAPIVGADGKTRRFVYLHYFKPGQPTMNWLDPSFAAQRIVAGDIIDSVRHLGDSVLRFDANPFLGIESTPGSMTSWSEGHPLSVGASNYLAWLTRKLGGFSFQELNLTLDTIRDFSKSGPDLSYDFITRPAVEHAMLTGDTNFLRLTMQLEKQYGIHPNSLIHDMQNHDEITYELVHFATHDKQKFNYEGKELTGAALRDQIVDQMHKLAIGQTAPYNRLSGNGLCTTFTGLIATRLRITDIYHLTLQQKETIKQGHLLLVLFNAMQPGVFGISGWDLVGALPLQADKIKNLLADGDYRWLNRGAYDLMNYNPTAETNSQGNIPKAQTLYGSLPEQLKDPNSFVSQLKHILEIRKQYQIDTAQQIALPNVKNSGAVIMVHKLPGTLGYEITALNFGNQPIIEQVDLSKISGIGKGFIGKDITDLLTYAKDSVVEQGNIINIKLDALQGKILAL